MSPTMKIGTFYKIVNDLDGYCWDSDNQQDDCFEDISLGDVFLVTDVGAEAHDDFNICLTKYGPGRILWLSSLDLRSFDAIRVEEL